uniref:Oligodendrocyte myelin glycoprotein n=1 Tax=Leptobrachium leishanense TaxID=445787 RepID=A0A8C5PIR6_9ANUR
PEIAITKMLPSQGLLLLFCLPNIFCVCPLKCSCSLRDRIADCSDKNLTTLPYGLQDNMTHLNLSHNHFTDLDYQLTRFTNLRWLDLSHNLLRSLPSLLPRSLWAVYASNNNIKALHKTDTAYQWNQKILDVSRNRLQRIVLINNTLTSLQVLNLSNNHLWTVPTNMPSNIQIIDLSNNYLIQILPGTLVRLHNLQKLYFHSNQFTSIPKNAFDLLTNLHEITLYDNPWSCEDMHAIQYLLEWVRDRADNVKGYPCANETYTLATVHVSATTSESGGVEDYDTLPMTTVLMFLEAQRKKKYKEVTVLEPVTPAPIAMTNMTPTSKEEFLIPEEGSADEIINFDYNNFSTRDVPLLTLNQLEVLTSEELEGYELYDSAATLRNREETSHNSPEVTLPSRKIKNLWIQASFYKISNIAVATQPPIHISKTVSQIILTDHFKA